MSMPYVDGYGYALRAMEGGVNNSSRYMASHTPVALFIVVLECPTAWTKFDFVGFTGRVKALVQ